REFALVAFGGAGPVHANRLAAEADVPTVIVPPSPGTTSALGLLVTDLQHDDTVTLLEPTEEIDLTKLNSALDDLERVGRATLEREGVEAERIRIARRLEMRYVGQSYELTIPLADGAL